MTLEAAIARPPRCHLVNVSTAESIDCLFNPTQLVEKLQVNWNRLAVPGLSHEPMQFFPSQYAMGDHARHDAVVFALGLWTTTHTSGDSHIVFARLKLTSDVTGWQFWVNIA